MNLQYNTPPNGDFARYVEELSARATLERATHDAEYGLNVGMPPAEQMHAQMQQQQEETGASGMMAGFPGDPEVRDRKQGGGFFTSPAVPGQSRPLEPLSQVFPKVGIAIVALVLLLVYSVGIVYGSIALVLMLVVWFVLAVGRAASRRAPRASMLQGFDAAARQAAKKAANTAGRNA